MGAIAGQDMLWHLDGVRADSDGAAACAAASTAAADTSATGSACVAGAAADLASTGATDAVTASADPASLLVLPPLPLSQLLQLPLPSWPPP